MFIVRDSCSHVVIDPEMLIVERWIPWRNPSFWKTVINLSSDSCVVNVAETRQILGYIIEKNGLTKQMKRKSYLKILLLLTTA